MSYSRSVILPLLFLLTLTGCKDAILEPNDSGNANLDIFESIWSDLDRNYSYFELKGIDWEQVYQQYRPMAETAGNSSQLGVALGGMLGELRDGHVTLYAGSEIFSYNGWYAPFPHNFDESVIRENYITFAGENSSFLYGHIRDTRVGYIRVKDFTGPRSIYEQFPSYITAIPHTDGLIVDVRDNVGGSDLLSRLIAGFFTDRMQHYSNVRYKNGTGHSDFGPWIKKTYQPVNGFTFSEPVVLLTNRRVFSSAEDFVLAMRVLPTVTVVGDTTGGGSGNPIMRELWNGWTYRFSRWQQVTVDFRQYEGSGLYPEHPVWLTEQDTLQGRDTILERALELLRQQETN